MKPIDIITLRVGQMAANCYIIADSRTRDALIVDPGDDAEYITDTISQKKVHPVAIVATHGHFDHIMGAFALQAAFRIPFFIHGGDTFLVARMRDSAKHFLGIPHVDPPPAIDRKLSDDQHVVFGQSYLTVLACPGHTPGSISLYHKPSGIILTGDTVFAGGLVGRTDHAYSSIIDLRISIRRILDAPEQTAILPGHGEPTTVHLAKAILGV